MEAFTALLIRIKSRYDLEAGDKPVYTPHRALQLSEKADGMLARFKVSRCTE